MTDGVRRYDDREVAEILERAADAELTTQPASKGRDGLTLSELQRIGAEAGLSPDLIARAAAALDARGLPARRAHALGIPVAVARAFPLARPLTREEWERLVASFRATFRARGRVRSDGDLREWSNGNLQALVEPAGDGWVLRFSTRKSDAAGLALMVPVFIVALAALVVLALAGTVDGLVTPGIIAAAAAARIGYGALRLPAWADERERQFEMLGEQAIRMTGPQVGDGTR